MQSPEPDEDQKIMAEMSKQAKKVEADYPPAFWGDEKPVGIRLPSDVIFAKFVAKPDPKIPEDKNKIAEGLAASKFINSDLRKADEEKALAKNVIKYKDFRFNLMACPTIVKQNIISQALIRNHHIVPIYPITSPEVVDPNALWESFDVSLVVAFAGYPHHRTYALSQLYGRNTFKFYDPIIMEWFLKRIHYNADKLRTVVINFGTTASSQHVNLGVRVEKIWYNLLLWFRRNNLAHLYLNFREWDHDETEDPTIIYPRMGVYRTLLTYRGLLEVVVRSGEWVDDCYASVLTTAMTLKPGETDQQVQQVTEMVKAPMRAKFSGGKPPLL